MLSAERRRSIGVDGDHPPRVKHRHRSVTEVHPDQLIGHATKEESYGTVLGRELKRRGAVPLVQALSRAVTIAVACSEHFPRLGLEAQQPGLAARISSHSPKGGSPGKKSRGSCIASEAANHNYARVTSARRPSPTNANRPGVATEPRSPLTTRLRRVADNHQR